MAVLEKFKLLPSELEEEATKIKNLIIFHLYKQGYIDEKDYNDLSLNYAILVRKPSFFSSLWKCLLKSKKEDELKYILVKQISLREPEENNSSNDECKKLKVVPIKKDT